MSDDRSENEDVIQLLIENGDALDQPRPIEHWACFPTEGGRARFIAYIESRYANIECSMNPEFTGKEYCVTFSHTGIPDADAITEITSALSLAADSCGGAYDGWETQVIR
jgi:Regulator of ribonuclease activity B